jgi:hypothetical protein
MLHRRVLALCVLVCSAAGIAFAQTPSNDRLTVVQDESSMERVIERYLIDVHKLIVTEKLGKGDDLYLEVPFKSIDGVPAFKVLIDTQATNRDKSTDSVIERGVLISLNTGIRVPAGKQDAVRRLLDDLNRRKVFASFYIDTDAEIIGFWVLNVLEEGLPTTYVYDALSRVQKIWREFWPQLSPALQ